MLTDDELRLSEWNGKPRKGLDELGRYSNSISKALNRAAYYEAKNNKWKSLPENFRRGTDIYGLGSLL